MSSKCPRILAIAGSDSGGGAGIQADIKTITMLGGHAMTAITAITAQNTTGVQAVDIVSADMVLNQIESVVNDIGIDALKIGMIGSADTAVRVAKYCAQISVPIVFDPVMVATSGSILSDSDTIAAFEKLMTVASVVTPNLPELEALGGRDSVLKHGCHLVVKGGHGSGHDLVDRLYSPTAMIKQVEGKRIDTDHTHGTGCTFAAALAFGLGKGMLLPEAFEQAVSFTRIAILEAPGIGRGSGPIGHQLVTNFQDSGR
ncbi:bifunctional hydroxymethylpyrimidine kinase/phosphomethylpyrimidine kinase [Parasphingorhabdus sp.]|jgi:hydroxymethylpyrimidine/phosphomethylpyrimidine kinase|uniref:bifunctional hydroxymethylpyrimidine kinase/phosphomethylpyrimidine kinase n=1 Tax=Parasphingorhabdus sp. TaxID=2709688 RepID=UPI003D2B6324